MVKAWEFPTFWMYIITGSTFVIFSSLAVLSFLVMMEYVPPVYLHTSTKVEHLIKPFATVFMIFTALKAVFSILSAIGIKKEQPLLIAFYVAYGMFMVINVFILALMLLLWLYWADALVALIFDGLYVYCLVKMYDGYESIMRGKCSGNLEHNLLQEEEQQTEA